MKLLIDQNLSPKLVHRLADLFPGSLHVLSVQMDEADDEDVWVYAEREEFIVVSKDEDYSTLSMMRGTPPKLIWIQTGNCTTNELEALFRDRIDDIRAFVANDTSAILILD